MRGGRNGGCVGHWPGALPAVRCRRRRGIVVADLSESGAQAVATEVKGLAVACDVAVEAADRRTRAAYRSGLQPDRPVRLERRPGDQGRSRGSGRRLAAQLGRPRHVPRLRGPRRVARNDRAWPRLSAQHGFSGRPAHRDGVGTLFSHQARGRGLCRMAVDPALRGGHSRLVPVPDGRDDEHADRRQPARQLSQTDGGQPRARGRGMREGHPRRAVHGPAAPGGQGVLRLPRQRYGPLDERHAAAQQKESAASSDDVQVRLFACHC